MDNIFFYNMNNLIFDEFTLFDIFSKNNELYLIMSINNDQVQEENIILENNNVEIKFKKKLVKDKDEPILIFIYDYPVDKNTIVNFIYKNKKYKLDVPFISSEKIGNIALTTLFKDDYNIFPIFYNYYMKQGVDHFYMYYNGIINDKIKNIFNYKNVTLIQWDFRYWNKNCKYRHHAQMGQLHNALYKFGKNNFNYMIFCDFDEYLYVEKKSLKSFIKKYPNIDIFGFRNQWADTLKGDILKNELPSTILVNEDTCKYPKRAKNIYKLNSIRLIGIHKAYYIRKKKKNIYNIINDLYMFHFYKWTSKPRKNISDKWYKLTLD